MDLSMAATLSPARRKPLLRGWFHLVAFILSVPAGAVLVSLASSGRGLATAVYACSLAGMFGVSALYHRPHWEPGPRAVLRRLDHSAITLHIAGAYTLFSSVVGAEAGTVLLVMAWSGAAICILRAYLYESAPKQLNAALYVLYGCSVILYLPELYAAVGHVVMGLLVLGGALFALGALIFALRRPDPWPHVFGYHEIFHILVVFAAVAHYVAAYKTVVGRP